MGSEWSNFDVTESLSNRSNRQATVTTTSIINDAVVTYYKDYAALKTHNI